MPIENMSWLTRILNWFLSWSRRRDAQAAADTAAIQQNKDAEHAVERVESQPDPSRAATDRRLLDGSY